MIVIQYIQFLDYVFEISSVQANNMNVIRLPNFSSSGQSVQFQIRGAQYTSIAILGYNSERIYYSLNNTWTMGAYGIL